MATASQPLSITTDAASNVTSTGSLALVKPGLSGDSAVGSGAVTSTGGLALSKPGLSGSITGLTSPAFPSSPLGAMVELYLGDDWTDITEYVKLDNAAGITLTYGRADGSQTVNPSTAGMTWNNYDGRFSPRNPLGPYYGQLQRNTPVRVSIPAEQAYLNIAEDRTSYAFAADTSPLSITGSIDIRLDLSLMDYSHAALCNKSNPTGNQRSWLLEMNPDNAGSLEFFWYPDGVTQYSVGSGTALPVQDRIAIRVTLNASNGVVTFYTADTIAGPWTQFGQSYSGTGGAATSIYNSTAPVVIGDNNVAPYSSVYELQILNGIGGTVVADAEFANAIPGNSSMTDAYGNTWTLSGTAAFSDRYYLFHGECAALPQTWDREDIWTPVSAAGVLRRINQNNDSLQSPMYRGYVQLSGSATPVAYWPGEDQSNATQLAAAIGGRAMQIIGSPTLSSNSDFVCSQPLPVINGASFTGLVPAYTGGTAVIYRFLMEVPAAGETAGSKIARVHTTGTCRTLTLEYQSGGALELIGYDATGAVLFDSGVVAFSLNGELLRVSMELTQSGSHIEWAIATLEPGADSGLVYSGSVTGTVGNAVKVFINPAGQLTNTVFGHMSVQSTNETLFDLGDQLNAWQGETAAQRFARLCSEEGINCRIIGHPALAVLMGAQQVDQLANLLQECEDADQGMQFEPMDVLGLGYRTLHSICAQSPQAALDYSLDHLSPPLSITDDDQYTQNDITISQGDGSSARAYLDDGSPMSISNPPAGVGSYVYSNTVYVQFDSQLNDIANWILHLGTVNEERYPDMMVDLASYQSAIQEIFWPVLGSRVGDMVSVDNVPYFLPPDGIKAIVWGGTLVLGDYVCNVTWQTQPESPYEVLVANSGRANTSGSTLSAPVTASGGYAEIPCTSSYPLLGSSTTYNLTGSYISAMMVPSQGGDREMYMELFANSTNKVDMYYSSGSLAGRLTQAGTGTTVGTVTYNAAEHAFWKIAESGGTIFWYASPDGVTWTLLWSHTYTLSITSLSVYFTAGYYSTDTATTAYCAAIKGLINDDFTSNDISTVWSNSDGSVGIVVGGSLLLVTTDAGNVIWTTASADFPFDIIVGGERMTVLGISNPGGAPQLFWVTRAINGVVKPHIEGEPVSLFQPCYYGLA